MTSFLLNLVSSMALLVMPSAMQDAPEVKVLVLDALDGKPQANVQIEPLCAGPPRNFQEKQTLTNDKGIATIPYLCGDKQAIEIEVFPPNKKEQCGSDAMATLNDIMTTGFLSDPGSEAIGGMWCPAKVSKTLKPIPGQVIVFVKKPTWWQVHAAG